MHEVSEPSLIPQFWSDISLASYPWSCNKKTTGCMSNQFSDTLYLRQRFSSRFSPTILYGPLIFF